MTERDLKVVEAYEAGVSIAEICHRFGFAKRGRIYQILRRAGVAANRRGVAANRDAFVGINVSEDVKDALRAEAARRGVSVSSLSSDALRDMLVACGYPLEAEKIGAAR